MTRLLSLPATFVLMAIGILSACTATVEPGPSRPVACTMEHAPVCAERGNRQRTFSNACMARADGFRVVHRGQCQPNRPPQQACTREFDPVCAERGNRQQTFSNACLARADGFRVVHRGQCRSVRPPRPPVTGGPAACTMEHAPVCAERGNRQQTFSNACLARADGFRVVHSGQCRPVRPPQPPAIGGPVACTMEHAPVCARRGNRQRTFSNACLARADGYNVVHNGGCR